MSHNSTAKLYRLVYELFPAKMTNICYHNLPNTDATDDFNIFSICVLQSNKLFLGKKL